MVGDILRYKLATPQFIATFTFAFLTVLIGEARAERTLTRMSEIRNTLMTTIGPLVGIAVGIIVVATIAAMAIIGGRNSGNLTSATTQVGAFMAIIGVGIGLAAFLKILGKV